MLHLKGDIFWLTSSMGYIEIQEEQREDERGCVGNENIDVGGKISYYTEL